MTYPHLSESLPQLATPGELVDYLRRSEASIVRDCRRGALPALKIGHRWLIDVRRLAAQLGGSVRPASPVPTPPHPDYPPVAATKR